MTDINEMRFSPKDDIHLRRAKVARLRWVQKIPTTQIAQLLGEKERTIYRDLEAIKEINAAKRKAGGGLKQDTNTVLAQLEMAHAERQRSRWQEYHSTKDAGLKRRYLNDIAEDEEKHIKTLQSMGVVNKAAENINLLNESWAEKLARLKTEREAAVAEPKT